MLLKRDSPADLVEALQTLEDRSDLCFKGLRLYSAPRRLAAWAILVSLVLKSEEVLGRHGYKNYAEALINLSQQGALALRWAVDNGGVNDSGPQLYSWNASLSEAAEEVLSVATNYAAFLDFFPMWHRDRLLAAAPRVSTVRFEVPGGTVGRRVWAFHKGFGSQNWTIPDERLTLTAEQTHELDLVVSQCFCSGDRMLGYPEPLVLYRLLLPSHLGMLTALFRRGERIDLGPYTLGDLKQGYAALLTICAVHENLCFLFGRAHEYPVNSCVMMRSPEEWSQLISRISGLDETTSKAIVTDLTVGDRLWDLHVQPFIRLDANTLAVAPPFPLSSRPDENILRVCNHVRPAYFAEASRLKEQEMLDDLLPRCSEHLSPRTRIRLPMGEIDLLLVDEDSLAVVVAELKWLRKPFNWRERIDREADFNDGVSQISGVRSFLAENPLYLREKGMLMRGLNDYSRVEFVLIARDHFLWSISPNVLVVNHEVFREWLARGDTLADLIDSLRKYEWLPVENIHFTVRFEPRTANGVTIESEVFYKAS